MKVLHINYSDIHGGAARAAYRIHQALRSIGINSLMRVGVASAGDWTVEGPLTKLAKLRIKLFPIFSRVINKIQKTANSTIHSNGLLPSYLCKECNSSNADVVYIHWVNSEMMSIKDIGRIDKQVVWTLHDIWAFCGMKNHISMRAKFFLGIIISLFIKPDCTYVEATKP